jgi:Trk K+ transport system NAD-binding subunit
MEEIEVTPGCEGDGMSIGDVRGQSLIVAVRHPDGQLEAPPLPHSVIKAGDMLIALGSPTAIESLEGFFQPASAVAT